MKRQAISTGRLERAVIATLAAYALVVQVLLGAVANGAALSHDLDGLGQICNTGGAVASQPEPGRAPGAMPERLALCCLVVAVTAMIAPVAVATRGAAAVLHLAAPPPPVALVGATVSLVSKARAPPAG